MIKILLLLGLTTSAVFGDTTIRILIAQNLRNIQISGIDLTKNSLIKIDKKKYSGEKKFIFNCKNISKKIIRQKRSLGVAEVYSSTGLISWGKEKYRGKLSVYTQAGKRSCYLVNEIKLEHYISSLLAKEMNSSWPIEALKAQAIAARSYAFHKIKTTPPGQVFNIVNSERNQVNGTFFDETIRTYKAANDTEGIILITQKEKAIPIFFHSKCGGRTLLPHEVWANKVPGYKSVSCPFCHKHGETSWEKSISNYKIKKKINRIIRYSSDLNNMTKVKPSSSFKVLKNNEKNKVVRMYMKDNLFHLKKSSFRKAIGRETFPSNNFKVIQNKRGIIIKGKGNGHGVGMCQFGALELSDRGYNYKQILNHYFPLLKLKKII